MIMVKRLQRVRRMEDLETFGYRRDACRIYVGKTHPVMPLHIEKYSYFLPPSITIRLLCIKGLLHVSAFSVPHHQAIRYIKHKYVYRKISFASTQTDVNNTLFTRCRNYR